MEHVTSGMRQVLLRAMRNAPASDRLEMAWQVAVGTAVASRTTVAGCHAGTLTIAVPDSSWAAQLGMLGNEYLRELEVLVPGEVKALQFIEIQ